MTDNTSRIESLEERLKTLEEALGWAMTVQASNSESWMRGFARQVNHVLVQQHDARRCYVDGDQLAFRNITQCIGGPSYLLDRNERPRVDFPSLDGRFFIVGSGEGGYPGEIVNDACECHERLIETLRADVDDDDTGWIMEELRDSDNWNFDESNQPYWFSFDIGEISRIHVIRVAGQKEN